MKDIEELIIAARDAGASDLHIVSNLQPRCRVDGKIKILSYDRISAADCETVAQSIAGDQYEQIRYIGEMDIAKTFLCGVRTRINIFRQQGSVSITVRLLNDHIPTVEELGLPEVVKTFPKYSSGIILITGETGSGKSTTLASIMEIINHSLSCHVLTIEDPVEYIFTPDKAIFNQRQIGIDTKSYADALRSVLREDPDIIFVGEMRDTATIEAALTTAETGHLVFGMLHTKSAAEAVDRIVNSFPADLQPQVRSQLANSLNVILTQQLLPKKLGGGRVPACEVMVANSAIRNLIAEGKTGQIDSFITMGAQEGSISMDASIQNLMRESKISNEVAYAHCRDKDKFKFLR